MNLLQLVRHSPFLRHNTVFFFGSVAVGALNYLYYPVLGRLLDPAAFGEVQALVSLFLQLAIFLSVFGLVTTNVVANYGDQAKRNAVVLELEKLALTLSLAFLLLVIAFQHQLRSFLQFDSTWPFIILAVAIVVSVPFTFRSAFLRGQQAFGATSVANIVGAAAKLLFSAILVAIGLGTAGAIGGLVLAQAVAWGYAAWKAAQLGLVGQPSSSRWRLPDVRLLAPELKYGLLVFISSFVITVQYSIDIVVVKHFFDAHTAGLYAGVASVARIIFFLTASVAQVLMPSIKLTNPPGKNYHIALRSGLLLVGVSLPVLLLFTFAPSFIVGLLMGSAFKEAAHLLPQLSLAIFIISILNLAVAYYLSLRRWGIAVVTLLGGIVTYALMAVRHDSLEEVISSLLIGSVCIVIALAIWIAGTRAKELLWQSNN
ncbi:MAG TPA: oligosaccharide flippase family protein [Candidatus Saccharimonadales bacterium]|nr:oligosaccharide flippase family protein [Candidatus Saccharimonadales bacterium]